MAKIKMDSQKIEKAIEDFESAVDFELVPVIAKSSTPMLHVRWFVAVMLMLVSLCVIEAYYVLSWSEWEAQRMIEVISFVLILDIVIAIFLSRWESLQRWLTPKKLRDDSVQSMAERVYLKKRLFETHANQGLLLFISLLEHRIVILPDFRSEFKGSKKLSEEILKILQESFKENHYEEGLLKSIQHMKSSLASEFPKKTASDNQIPNKLIWWD